MPQEELQNIGTIVHLQHGKVPGILKSQEINIPFISSDQWQIGDVVTFDLRDEIIDGIKIKIAVNLRSPGSERGEELRGQDGLELFLKIEKPNEPHHKYGHVSNPRPGYSSQNGLNLMWIDGKIYSRNGPTNYSFNQEVWYDTLGTDTVDAPPAGSGNTVSSDIIVFLTTFKHH